MIGCSIICIYNLIKGVPVGRGHLDVGTCPLQVLAATLTLSQPGGEGQIIPTLYWGPHQVLKATGAPE